MNQTSLDKQSGGAEDGQIARIVRLETNMDNVTSTLSLLQKREEEHYQATMARMEQLNQATLMRVDHLHQLTLARMDQHNQSFLIRTDQQYQTLSAKIDQQGQSISDRIDRSNQFLLDRMDRGFTHVHDRIDRLAERNSRDLRWVIGLLLTNTVALVGISLRLIAA
jgi:hypothetical protein